MLVQVVNSVQLTQTSYDGTDTPVGDTLLRNGTYLQFMLI